MDAVADFWMQIKVTWNGGKANSENLINQIIRTSKFLNGVAEYNTVKT
jgi:hypothetical protein